MSFAVSLTEYMTRSICSRKLHLVVNEVLGFNIDTDSVLNPIQVLRRLAVRKERSLYLFASRWILHTDHLLLVCQTCGGVDVVLTGRVLLLHLELHYVVVVGFLVKHDVLWDHVLLLQGRVLVLVFDARIDHVLLLR